MITRWIAWAVPSISFSAGLALSLCGSVTSWQANGADVYSSVEVVLWPAGLVLIGCGVLGPTAVALVETAIRGDPRASRVSER